MKINTTSPLPPTLSVPNEGLSKEIHQNSAGEQDTLEKISQGRGGNHVSALVPVDTLKKISETERLSNIQKASAVESTLNTWIPPAEERQAIFVADGTLKPEFITPTMQLQMLRTHFAQLRGVPEFVTLEPSLK